VKSRLAALRKERSHPQLRAAIERSWSREWLRRRATVGEVMRGFGDPGCARGSYRLQKSTSGAWPLTPGDEESPDHERRSSSSARERSRGERASEAGSSVAKPRDRWRVPSKPEGLRERIFLGTLVEERRSEPGKLRPLTRVWWKRFWLSTIDTGLPASWGATGRARGQLSNVATRSKTPGQRGAAKRYLTGPGQTPGAATWAR